MYRKKIIITLIFSLIFLSVLGASVVIRFYKVRPKTNEQIETVIPSTPDASPYSKTGGILSTPTPEELTIDEMIYRLKKLSPYENEFFSIKFDYKINKFIVVLKGSKNVARQNLDTWLLQQNAYDLINDKIYFK